MGAHATKTTVGAAYRLLLVSQLDELVFPEHISSFNKYFVIYLSSVKLWCTNQGHRRSAKNVVLQMDGMVLRFLR